MVSDSAKFNSCQVRMSEPGGYWGHSLGKGCSPRASRFAVPASPGRSHVHSAPPFPKPLYVFADSAGRFGATLHDWGNRGGLRNPQKAQTGLTEGLGTAFPQKGGSQPTPLTPPPSTVNSSHPDVIGYGFGFKARVLRFGRINNVGTSLCD